MWTNSIQFIIANYRTHSGTVDGSEIRRSAVEGTIVYPIIYRVLAPSQVVQDFYWPIMRLKVVAVQELQMKAVPICLSSATWF